MASPTALAYYPRPSRRVFSSAERYVRALQLRLRQAVAQNLGLEIPVFYRNRNRFFPSSVTMPGFSISYPTSPAEAVDAYNRIASVSSMATALGQVNTSLTNTGVIPGNLRTALESDVFTNFRIEVQVLRVHPPQYSTLVFNVTREQLRPLLDSASPVAAIQDWWIDTMGRPEYENGLRNREVRLVSVAQTDWSSNTLSNEDYNQSIASLNSSLMPTPSPRGRLRGSGVTHSLNTNSVDDIDYPSVPMPPLMVLRPNRRRQTQLRFQHADAPLVSSPFLPAVDLDLYRKHRFDATEIYQSEYMQTMRREDRMNMCWFGAVCDLVNHACNGAVLTFDVLLELLNHHRMLEDLPLYTMQCVRSLGLSIEDMDFIFKHYDRRVLVYNLAEELIYEHVGNRHKRRKIKPFNWVFVVGNGHVYPVHNYDHRKHRVHQTARNASVVSLTEEPDDYENSPLSPVVRPSPMNYMFPHHLRSPNRDLRLTSPDTPEVDRLVHLLYRDTSLYKLLMEPDPALQNRRVVVLVDQKDDLEAVYLRMVYEYHHRPEVFFYKATMTQLRFANHGHYREVIIKNMAHFNTVKHPDVITAPEMYLAFQRHVLSFRRIVFRTSHLSFVSQDVHDIFSRFPRIPWVGRVPGVPVPRNISAVDFNRCYGHALQTLPYIPVLYPYSQFIPPTGDKVRDIPVNSFVMGRVRKGCTPYLNRETMLVWLPHLLEHVKHWDGVEVVTKYHPLFHQRSQVVFQIELVCEATQLVPTKQCMEKYMLELWGQTDIPRACRKFVINSTIGMLGTKENDLKPFRKVLVVDNPDEFSLLGSESQSEDKYCVQALDEQNFALVPKLDPAVVRYQTGMMFHQVILDAAMLSVSNFVYELHKKEIPVCAILTDELYFPTEHLETVRELCFEGDQDSFAANGQLKVSREHVDDLREGDHEFEVPCSITDFYLGKLDVANHRLQSPAYEIYPETMNVQSVPRLLLTASVPGAGKTHTIATQPGITGVIAVPTNALAVDLKTKFPQHKVITIHKLLARVGRAFGLLDMIAQPDQLTNMVEVEGDEDAPPPVLQKGLFRETDTFLCVDEIYMLPTQVLLALYHLLSFLPNHITHVYATGDPYQLDPIEDSYATLNSGQARHAMIVKMFRHRIHLQRCRRMNSEELNRRVEVFCEYLRNNRGLEQPVVRIQALRSICQSHNIKILRTWSQVIGLMHLHNDMLVAAYTNQTCHRVTESVLGSLEGKLEVGCRLINRRRRYLGRGAWMHLNYVYTVMQVNSDMKTVLLKEDGGDEPGDGEEDAPMDDGIWVAQEHVIKHMHWYRTRTAHCLQGTSWNGGVVVCDADKNFLVSRAYFYVTMTRARDFNRLFVYIPS